MIPVDPERGCQHHVQTVAATITCVLVAKKLRPAIQHRQGVTIGGALRRYGPNTILYLVSRARTRQRGPKDGSGLWVMFEVKSQDVV